jgi:hypothetical protein
MHSMIGTRGAVAGLVVLGLAGCGGAATVAGTAPAVSQAPAAAVTTAPAVDYAAQYLRIVGPANTALAAFGKAAQALPAGATAADVARLAAPALADAQTADNKLLRAVWPVSAQADIKALVTADAGLIAALQDTSASAQDYLTGVSQAGAKAGAAANIVRADLGLPPNS